MGDFIRRLRALFGGRDLFVPFSPRDIRKRVRPYIKAAVSDERDDPALPISLSEMPVLRGLGNGLLVAYLVDCGDRLEYVKEGDLEKCGIDAETLHTEAMRNLEQLASEMRLHPYGAICGLLLDGIFEATLLLADSLWESLRPRVQSTFAVAVPARDMLAFCDSESAEGINELQAMVDRVWPAGDHLITRRLYVRMDGRWVERNEESA